MCTCSLLPAAGSYWKENLTAICCGSLKADVTLVMSQSRNICVRGRRPAVGVRRCRPDRVRDAAGDDGAAAAPFVVAMATAEDGHEVAVASAYAVAVPP